MTITADAARLAFGTLRHRLRGGRCRRSRSSAAELRPHEIRVVCIRSMGLRTLPPRGGVETTRRPSDLVARRSPR